MNAAGRAGLQEREAYADGEDAIWSYQMVIEDGCFEGTLEGPPESRGVAHWPR